MSFFPKADAAVLPTLIEEDSLPLRPTDIGPIYDADTVDTPIEPWSQEIESCFYPPKLHPYGCATIPKDTRRTRSRYLRASLARNERLRLSMLWYYGRDLDKEPDLLSGLQEKACLAQESSGWEYAVVGLLDVNVYIRLATVGLPIAILPRGETLCAHTVMQPPGVRNHASDCRLWPTDLLHIERISPPKYVRGLEISRLAICGTGGIDGLRGCPSSNAV